MMRRVTVRPLATRLLPVSGTMRYNSSSTTSSNSGSTTVPNDSQKYAGPIPGAHGPDNAPGIYSKPSERPYFEKGQLNPRPEKKAAHEPSDRSDNIKYPEYDLLRGQFENVPVHIAQDIGTLRQQKYTPPEPKESVEWRDVMPQPPQVGHNPNFEYLSNTGKKEGNPSNMAGTISNWDLKAALFSLYRCCLRGVPLVKHFYWLTMPVDEMLKKVRHRFEVNKHVRDPDAIRHLLHNGWAEYQDTMAFRRTRASVLKYFDQYEDRSVLRAQYSEEEGQLMEERRFWSGEEQRKEGPYNGHWSEHGIMCEEAFDRIAGRIPKPWTTSKGYFDITKADGTNYWEKNLDYEGWYIKNVDPDVNNARKEAQGWIESGYNQPKHYISKNRRGFRRLVKDLEAVMESSVEETYTRNRELYFQQGMREIYPEANRVYSEKRLAMRDDEMYSTNWTEIEKIVKQVMREMPNPRMWKTDAFYCRYKYLAAGLEYNWARVPIGSEQELLFNQWISDDINYAVYNSKAFESLKRDKKRNPMAASWGDFYRTFDPDDTNTRGLPWYHPEFNYDRRHKWDEFCMRKKKWVDSGDIDTKHAYFDSLVAEWEQRVNRSDMIRDENKMENRYLAPRMVQLYRALNKLMDVALANQMRAVVEGQLKGVAADKMGEVVDKADFSGFQFKVPVLIYPDGAEQPRLGLDGSPQ